jgi:integration host factor subunit beta
LTASRHETTLKRMSAEDLEDASKGKASLTESHLTEAVGENIGVPRNEASMIVESIFESIVRALHRGERIEIRGFGSFGSRGRRARNGRNTKSGARVPVPAKRVIAFKSSKQLLSNLNGLPRV